MGKGNLYWIIDELFRGRKKTERRGKKKRTVLVSDDTVKVTETTKKYELLKDDLVTNKGEDEPTWYNKSAGIIDKFRIVPRLIMLAYIYAFYSTTVWFMSLSNPSNAQAAFISTIVGAGAAFFGLYVGKPGASIPKGRQ